MKMKVLLAVLCFIISNSAYSQNSGWLVLQSGTAANLHSVHFEDFLTGWVCGANGTILKTSDGGNTWPVQPSGTSAGLNSIYFISVNTGWAGGEDNTLLRTTNGGSTWSSSNSGIIANIRSVWFINSNTGYAAGSQGRIYRTTNAGALWAAQISGISADINSIMFVNDNTGWACGNTGKILKTTNAGASWSINIDHGQIADFYGVYFSNTVRGIAVGRYFDQNNNPFVYFYKTYTSGTWWEYQASGDTKILRSVFFADSVNGWAAGESGTLYGTTNKGATWIDQNSRTTNDLNAIYFISRSVGFAAGKNGTIIKTNHAGYRDTISTNRRDLGVTPLVENVSQLINASYRVQFRADTSYNIMRSLNNGASFDTITSGISLADTGRYLDGMLIRVKKIKFISGAPPGNYTGNVGVVKDPELSVDSIQTRFYGWEYLPPQNRYLDSTNYKPNNRSWQSKSMSISYPTRNTYVGFRSLLNPEDIRKVKIVFTGYGSGQMAYRYLATSVAVYAYQDMREVPFKVYEMDETDGTPAPRQLNCGFLEFPDGAPDNKWEPTADSLAGKEVLYIFGSDYSSMPSAPYTTLNLLIQQSQFDIMYVWAPRRISPSANFQAGDEFHIHPYTVTRPEIAPGYPLYYEWKTQSVIGIEPISTFIPEKFTLRQNYPNPFNPVTKIRFDLPKALDVKISVYDILGREVDMLLNKRLSAGEYEADWDGSAFATGVYFCRIETIDFSAVIKMVLIK